jgi:hypothetical protein
MPESRPKNSTSHIRSTEYGTEPSTDALYLRHRILEHGETRVIFLEPAETLEAPVVCDLKCISLETNETQYEAVSYTWGAPDYGTALPSQSITFCGLPTFVAGNLFDALRRLRLPNSPRELWVDALCINQQDPLERSAQVSIMGQIYAKAHGVLVWLDEYSLLAEGERLFVLCRLIYRHREALSQVKYYKTDPRWATIREEFQASPCVREGPRSYFFEPRNDSFDGGAQHFVDGVQLLLNNFWSRTYFNRRWVLQEIHHAKSAEVHCGAAKISWYELSEARDIMRQLRVGGGEGVENLTMLLSWAVPNVSCTAS